MNQQINLFHPIFKKERKLISFMAVMNASILIVLLLFGMYWLGQHQIGSLFSQIETLKQQHTVRLKQLQQVTQFVLDTETKYKGSADLNQLEYELRAEQYLLSLMKQSAPAHKSGFSAYFESFARQSIQGMWIKGFSLTEGGKGIEIWGSALKPEMIPSFIDGLANESPLSGTKFGILKMVREEPNAAWIDFLLFAGKSQPNHELE